MNGKRITMAGALALMLAVGVACQKAGPPAEGQPSAAVDSATVSRPQVRTILISATHQGNKECLWVPDLVSVGVGDTVLWVNTTTEKAIIQFGGQSPFSANSFHIEDHAIGGGIVLADANGKRFHYDIPSNGCAHTETGPDVIVDGGTATPPPSH